MIRMVGLSPLLLMASAALACPVCGGGGPNQQAYIDTMVFLSALPLLMLGSVAFFFWWKMREASALGSDASSQA
ncbi:MAG: hypothetical protein ACI8PZ_000419 [Myxococcota bacterium]|jgi:hypothetical protein